MGPSQSSITQWRWHSTPCGAASTRGIFIFVPGFYTYRDMERLQIRRWKLIFPGCRETSALAGGATLAVRWRHGPQNILNPSVGLGFPHPAGRCRPDKAAFSFPGCWSYGDIEEFLIRRWELVVPGCGGTWTWARGATLATRWLGRAQPIIHHPVALGLQRPAGRYRPRGCALSAPGCSCNKDTEERLIRGWEVILSGCGGTSALARGATLAGL